jgi:hypothetical protein
VGSCQADLPQQPLCPDQGVAAEGQMDCSHHVAAAAAAADGAGLR